MTFEHLDTGKTLKLEFRVFLEDGHWVAQMAAPETATEPATETAADQPKAPTFYGTTPEQAERQLRKTMEKEYELVGEEPLAD